MSRYRVFEPKTSEGPSAEARFVRDAFTKWAVLFPFVWLVRHGLWLSGLIVFLAWIGLGLLAEIKGLALAGAVLPILLGCLIALEGPSLRARKLQRAGFEERAVVEADDEDEAAILYGASAGAATVTRETPRPPPFVGRPASAASSLLDTPRRVS
ncbi:hypothetical protein ASG43_15470 [Aureimonas sp. Leaf454]|uniref:DUF2628 domain-containing protein n=1 Tax=Aureimonas sp. Leaf454 TaxID=1736381 RepID=UPI0006FE7E7C|nr:DUF2628 domain-containing protein [Aureimonas sp. Leaf454]KQT42947.1 hypothetical protein ASG43_15470 [Aureimonas sp. Leaf454]